MRRECGTISSALVLVSAFTKESDSGKGGRTSVCLGARGESTRAGIATYLLREARAGQCARWRRQTAWGRCAFPGFRVLVCAPQATGGLVPTRSILLPTPLTNGSAARHHYCLPVQAALDATELWKQKDPEGPRGGVVWHPGGRAPQCAVPGTPQGTWKGNFIQRMQTLAS